MSQGIQIASIYADLGVNSTKLERGIAAGRRALQAMAAEIERVKEAAAGPMPSILPADANKMVQAFEAEMRRLSTAMQGANSRVAASGNTFGILNAAMNTGASGGQRFGMALMQVGAIVDDLQYGLQGAVNNIAPLALALSGGNQGVAAAAQVAAVGIMQLIKHWDDLRAAFGRPIEATVRITTEHLLEENSPEAIKQRALQMEKERDQRVNQLDREPTDEEKKAADAWKDAIKESPNDGGQASIATALATQMPEHHATDEEQRIAWDQALAEHPALAIAGGIQQVTGLGLQYKDAAKRGRGDLGMMSGTTAAPQIREAYEAKLAELERLRRIQSATNLLDQASGTGLNAQAARDEIEKRLRANPKENAEALAYIERAKGGKTKKKDRQIQQEQHALGLVHSEQLDDEDARRHAENADARKAADQLLANRGVRGQMLANPAANVDDEIRKTLEAMKYSKEAIANLLPVVRGIMAHSIQTQVGDERSAHGGTAEQAAERLRVRQEQQELRPLGLIRARDIKDPDAQRHAYQQDASRAAQQLMINRKVREKLLTDQKADVDNEIRALLQAASFQKDEIEKMLPMVRGIMGHKIEQDIATEQGAHGGTAKEAAERLKSESAAQGGPSTAQARAIAANRKLRQQLLRGQKITDADVAKAMKAAGYTDDQIKARGPTFREEMERGIAEEKKERASKQNITGGEAGRRIADEEEHRRKTALENAKTAVRSANEHLGDAKWNMQQRILDHNKPQFMGLTDYAKKLAVGGFETRQWQHEMLVMQRGIRNATENVTKAIEAEKQVKSTYD